MLGSLWSLQVWALPALQPSSVHQKCFVWPMSTVLKLSPSSYNYLIRYPAPPPQAC